MSDESATDILKEAAMALRSVMAIEDEDDSGDGYSATCSSIANKLDGLVLSERADAVAWLKRRAQMSIDAKRWWRPLHNRLLGAMAGTFQSAALIIEREGHLAENIEAETKAILSAQQALRGGNPK